MGIYVKSSRYVVGQAVLCGLSLVAFHAAALTKTEVRLAALVACDVESGPSSKDDDRYTRFVESHKGHASQLDTYAGTVPANYACAKAILSYLPSQDEQQAYCALLARGLGPVSSAGGPARSLGANSMFEGGDDEGVDNSCDSEGSSDYASFQSCVNFKREESQKQSANSGVIVKNFCTGLGINMDAPRSGAKQVATSFQRAGLDAYGNPCSNRGGLTIIKEPAWATLLKAGSSYLNNRMAINAMSRAAGDQQQTARLIAGYDHDLGFPTGLTSGSSGQVGIFGNGGVGGVGGYGVGGIGINGAISGGFGYGQYGQAMPCTGQLGVYGQGGCGSYYPGMNGQIGINSGFSGGCPTGACYGNGGYIVGAGAGGTCMVPPYNGSGCGGGIASPYGQYGQYGQTGLYGAGGYGAGGVGYGMGQYGNGMYGSAGYGMPGAGYGMPGGYGTGGYSPYGGAGQWSPNGTYGQSPYWATNPANSGMMAQQAQMYQQWQQFQQSYQIKQDRNTAQYARLYQQRLNDVQAAGTESWQYYNAFQQSSGGAYGTNSPQGSGGYYPPLQSGAGY